MEDKIKNCTVRACLARQNALMSGNEEQKQSWTIMADMWDAMAREYRDLDVEDERIRQAEARGLSGTANVIQLICSPDARAKQAR